jgi:hypothetical protein
MRRKAPPPAAKLVLASAFAIGIVSIANTQVIVGPDVSMAGGPASFTPPSTFFGDPLLLRQNEPSIAFHPLVSAGNDCPNLGRRI